jgi:hypothetical protein
MHETDALANLNVGSLDLAELSLADLVADARQITLPAPRTPDRPIDLTVPAPRTLRIPDATVSLVEGYSEYGV